MKKDGKKRLGPKVPPRNEMKVPRGCFCELRSAWGRVYVPWYKV